MTTKQLDLSGQSIRAMPATYRPTPGAEEEASVVDSDVLHPIIRVRASSWYTQEDGSRVHFFGFREATLKQAIELEAAEDVGRRPSWRMDHRTTRRKLSDWVQLLLTCPADAIALLHINRHPSMVTGEYDYSDNWSGKRWARAIAEYRRKDKSLSLLHVVPEATTAESQSQYYDFELPAFLRKQAD